MNAARNIARKYEAQRPAIYATRAVLRLVRGGVDKAEAVEFIEAYVRQELEAVAETEAILADPDTMAAIAEGEADIAAGRVSEAA